MFYQPMLDYIIIQKVTPREFMVFCMIARHMDKEGKRSFPSTLSLSMQTGISRRAIQKSVKSLVNKNYLKVAPWKRHATTYELGSELIRFLPK